MKLEQPAPIRKPLPLTPLVDVVFLLLMFFMLSSTFTRFGNIGLTVGTTSPESQRIDAAKRRPGLIVRVAPGPKVSVNGEAVETGALAALLDAFKDKGVEAAAIQAAPAASVQDLVTVLEAARASRLTQIFVTR